MKRLDQTKKTLILLTAVLMYLYVSDSFAERRIVRIAVAAALVPVMTDIKQVYESENSDVVIEIIPGASGSLTTQIINGAPYDIFASADMDYPEKLRTLGMVSSGPDVFAQGGLVLFTVKNLNLSEGIGILKDGSVKKISIANPDVAPYGRAAIDAIKNAGLLPDVQSKLIYAGNVSLAAHQVISGSDAGLIARSLMFEKPMLKYREKVNWITIPEKLSQPLKQGIVLLYRNPSKKDAEKVYRFILSGKVRPVFARYGFK